MHRVSAGILPACALWLAAVGCAPVRDVFAAEPSDVIRRATISLPGRCAGVIASGGDFAVTAAHCISPDEDSVAVEFFDGSTDVADVALLDRDTNTISLYDRNGKPGVKLARSAEKPADIAFDSMGHLYVLDRAAVLVFAPDGKLVTTFAMPDTKAPGGFRDASAFALDDAGRLYVYDERAERIQIYQ